MNLLYFYGKFVDTKMRMKIPTYVIIDVIFRRRNNFPTTLHYSIAFVEI